MLANWFRIPLWIRIVIGLVLGAIVGGMFPATGVIVKPIGDIFLNAISMLIIPLVVSTLITGVVSVGDVRSLGKLGAVTFALYLGTTAVAISIGLGVGALLRPGRGLNLEVPQTTKAEPFSLAESIVAMVPSNPIQSMAETDVLPVIVFSLLFGIGMLLVGEGAKPLTRLFASVANVMFRMTHFIMEIAPVGVFALIAWVTSNVGIAALLPLAKLVLAVALACAIHIILVYGSLLRVAGGMKFSFFSRGIIDAQLVAFTTTSSGAALPVTFACVTEKIGVDKSTASFVLPLGATINMDGTALYMGVAALFAAEVYQIPLAPTDFGIIVFTATIASIGTASVPAAGLIMLSVVFSAVGLPMEAVALVAGIDRLLDMFRTMTNITGDATISVLAARFGKTVESQS